MKIKDYKINLQNLLKEIGKYENVLVTGGGKIINENKFKDVRGYRIIINSHSLDHYLNFDNIYINWNNHEMISCNNQHKYYTHKSYEGWKRLIRTINTLPRFKSDHERFVSPSTGCLALWIAINSSCKNIYIDGFDLFTNENLEILTENTFHKFDISKKSSHDHKKEKEFILHHSKKYNKILFYK